MKDSTPALLAVFVLLAFGCRSASVQTSSEKPALPEIAASSPTGAVIAHDPREAVVTYHEAADRVGYEILEQGGNAFDAFVAATAVEYVLGAGVTSPSGPMAALLYDAKTKNLLYLDAGFNQPLDPQQKFDQTHPKPGAAVLVPGAVAGLEAIAEKYGTMPFARLLQPAIDLADKGFPLDDGYAGILASAFGKRLKASSYAAKTYFHGDKPLGKGEILKLPAVAQFFRQLAKEGSGYVYRGAWARECVKEANRQGGHLSLEDFSAYRAEWKEPAHISYHGYDIYSSAENGGINTLMSLKVLERADLTKFGKHYSSSAGGLATMATIQDEVSVRSHYDEEKLADPDFVKATLSDSSADKIWKRVEEKIAAVDSLPTGSHTYHIVVVDKNGNTITGTNTIESFPWGKDIFVEGIPLTASGELPFAAKPGKRRRSYLSMQIGLKDTKPRFAVGAFSLSLTAAEFQFVTNIVDYKLSAHEVVALPRFGSHAWDIRTGKAVKGIWLDPRVDQAIVQGLAQKGLKFTQDGYIDTGLGSVALIHNDGTVEGAIASMTSIGQGVTKVVGIGAALTWNPRQQVMIGKIALHSPAEKAGLKVGDIILSVQTNPESFMVPITNKGIQDVIALIRGPLGVPVGLTIERAGVSQTLSIVREEVLYLKPGQASEGDAAHADP